MAERSGHALRLWFSKRFAKKLAKYFLPVILGLQCLSTALACTTVPNSVEPSVLQQFEKAEQVVYGVVDSVDRSSRVETLVKLKNVRTLKGPPIAGYVVKTYDGALCGADFQLGQEYVVFLPKRDSFVDRFDVPRKTPADVVRELHQAGMIP